MLSLFRSVFITLAAFVLLVQSLPLGQNEVPMQKRLSNDMLLRLLMRNNNQRPFGTLKRAFDKRGDMERRSVDDDFSNCFLSPVQCMLPSRRK